MHSPSAIVCVAVFLMTLRVPESTSSANQEIDEQWTLLQSELKREPLDVETITKTIDDLIDNQRVSAALSNLLLGEGQIYEIARYGDYDGFIAMLARHRNSECVRRLVSNFMTSRDNRRATHACFDRVQVSMIDLAPNVLEAKEMPQSLGLLWDDENVTPKVLTTARYWIAIALIKADTHEAFEFLRNHAGQAPIGEHAVYALSVAKNKQAALCLVDVFENAEFYCENLGWKLPGDDVKGEDALRKRSLVKDTIKRLRSQCLRALSGESARTGGLDSAHIVCSGVPGVETWPVSTLRFVEKSLVRLRTVHAESDINDEVDVAIRRIRGRLRSRMQSQSADQSLNKP